MNQVENKVKIAILEEIFSKDMSDYLSKDIDGWNEHFYSEVIGGSLLNINKKLEYAKLLGLLELEKCCQIAIDKLNRKDDELFILMQLNRDNMMEYLLNKDEEHKYNQADIVRAIDVLNNEIGIADNMDRRFVMPLLDYQNALKFINKDKEGEPDHGSFEYDKYYYYKLLKYKKRESNDILKNSNTLSMYAGDMFLDCEYYIVNGKITYFRQYDYTYFDATKEPSTYRMPRWEHLNPLQSSQDLNLPIPFKAGDLVASKLKPFDDDKNFLILKTGDNRDCCAVQVAYFDKYGRIKVGALKHYCCYLDCLSPCISPLYTLTRISENDLKPNEKLEFSRLIKKIDGDEAKGRKLWEELSKYI